MTDHAQPETAPLDDVAALLRKQLAACAALVDDCFNQAQNPEWYFSSRTDAMKVGARLIQSCTGLAIALKRLEGTQQNIVVTHAPAA